MKTRIALFDFDGTITRKDSLLVFIWYVKGPVRFVVGFTLLSPFLLAMKAGFMTNQRGKEIVLRYFFGGTPLSVFDRWCVEFANTRIPSIIRPAALDEIRRLQKDGTEVVIVSASPENWLSAWTTANGLSLLGTRLELAKGKITGMIQGKNCHGTEKVRRVLEKYPMDKNYITNAYGDTKGDLPMLQMAGNQYWKPFR